MRFRLLLRTHTTPTVHSKFRGFLTVCWERVLRDLHFTQRPQYLQSLLPTWKYSAGNFPIPADLRSPNLQDDDFSFDDKGCDETYRIKLTNDQSQHLSFGVPNLFVRKMCEDAFLLTVIVHHKAFYFLRILLSDAPQRFRWVYHLMSYLEACSRVLYLNTQC